MVSRQLNHHKETTELGQLQESMTIFKYMRKEEKQQIWTLLGTILQLYKIDNIIKSYKKMAKSVLDIHNE